ncbi:MAG: hypothetical protein PHG00_07410 [Methylococcales bacterium]|nr:hypothetical protein [Methylococcales bacterium]
MKHLNIKITLLAAGLLLAIGQSKANESELLLTNSPVSIFSYSLGTADFKGGDKFSSELTDSPFLLVKRCEISPGVKGKLCKTNGECVASQRDCPKKGKSPHNLNKDSALDSDGI